MFDIVKEIISDTLSGSKEIYFINFSIKILWKYSGLFARGLGLHNTARNGGEPFSFVSTVMNAVSKVASGQRCRWLDRICW